MSATVDAYGLIDNVYDDSADDVLKQKFISYSAIFITMVAFILSCIGISKGGQKSLEKTLYTFSFPYFNQVPRVESGMVVSIHTDSKVFTGAGVTVSRNVTFLKRNVEARNIITLNYDHEDVAEVELIFAASRGFIYAFEVSYDDIALSNEEFPLKEKDGTEILPEGMHWMDKNHIVILGNGKIVIYKVQITKSSKTFFDVNVVKVGEDYQFSTKGSKAYSHSDTLSRNRICMTWEEDDDLYTDVIIINFNSEPPAVSFMGKLLYNTRGAFHKVSGLDSRDERRVNYLVARVGDPEGKPGPIEIAYVYSQNDKLIATNYTRMPFSYSYGFFEMDNLNRQDAIMCYTNSFSDGITCTLIVLGPTGIVFGSHLTMHSGGAASYYSRMKLMIINGNNFGLLYADAEAGGAIVWAMAGKNDAGDLVRHGPEFVVSHRSRERRVLSNYIGVSRVDVNKVAIVELVRSEDGDFAYLHSAFLYPRPLGIAQRTLTGMTQVQFGGIWNTKKQLKGRKLRPGYLYYCNDRGDILRGGPHGYMNRNFGIQYVTSMEDDSLLSLHNQVGIAVGENELLVRFR